MTHVQRCIIVRNRENLVIYKKKRIQCMRFFSLQVFFWGAAQYIVLFRVSIYNISVFAAVLQISASKFHAQNGIYSLFFGPVPSFSLIKPAATVGLNARVIL